MSETRKTEAKGTEAAGRGDGSSTGEAGPRGISLDPETTTVHEAIHDIPGADEVFRRFGLDCCCGGELPVAVAAERHGVDLEGLLDALGGREAGV